MLHLPQNQSYTSGVHWTVHLIDQCPDLGWCTTPDRQAKYPLGEFRHPGHDRAPTCQHDPAPQLVKDTGSGELFLDQRENFLDTEFNDFAESPPQQWSGVAPAHPWHLDHLSRRKEIHERAAMTLFQLFGFGQGRAQPGCQVIGDMRPAEWQESRMLDDPAMERHHPSRAAADIEESDAQFFFFRGQDGLSRGQHGESQAANLQVCSLAAPQKSLDGARCDCNHLHVRLETDAG
jgi:hypothetical protein